ncbi:MAG: DUF4445 domain-containing protein [Chloroflexi bacterium]|nr:DUF4445 domain-containing protein [Chloroflexota bacterium]
MKYQITFLPSNQITHAPEGTTVFNAANWAGLAIDSTCGGRGTCGKCKVQMRAGANSISDADRKFLSAEELANGWRLSCRAPIHTECIADVPRLMTSPQAALLGYGRHVAIDPNVAKVYLQLREPSLEHQQSDLARVVAALDKAGYSARAIPEVWRALPKILRANDWKITCVLVGDELIAIEPRDTRDKMYGLSLDIGTTTVVGAIVDLNTGTVVAVKSALNSQAPMGADVISRVSHTMMNADGLEVLQSRIIGTINALLDELLAISAIVRENIYECVAVGNATMLHILLGIDPEPISVAPFIPTILESVTLPARDLSPHPSPKGEGAGVRLHSDARVSTLPHLGAYVGADIVAGILATGLARNKDEKIRLFIDVGTNGEIVLGSVKRTCATAAPAGPAFEGAQIKCGMRASNGAIEGVRISDDVELQTIGNVSPIGICGSGLVDAVAELVKCGLVDKSGKLLLRDEARARGIAEKLIARLVEENGVRAFLLAENIVLTQPDIRALQFAKGAISAGVQVLMQYMSVTEKDLHEVLLAGSFGSYINPASARLIGLVPWIDVEKIVAVGNSAGEGAKIALVNYREREAAKRIPEYIEYVELSGRAEFNDIFTEALGFPTVDG